MMSLRSSNHPLSNKDGVTIEDQVKHSDVFKDSITFDYKLNDKAAKAKIVKGAKRIAFEIQENSTSTTLVFAQELGKLLLFQLRSNGIKLKVT